jgi:hypothetical protein
LVEAGVAGVRGDGRAADLLATATAELDAVDMPLAAAAARRRLGILLGGDRGRELAAAADGWMASRGVRNPARMTAALVPGFPG